MSITSGKFAIAVAILSIPCVQFASLQTHAATISVLATGSSYEAQRNSSTGAYIASGGLGTAWRAGHQTNFNNGGANPPGGITTVLFFPLPAIGPAQTVANASFSVGRLPDSATTALTPTFNVDLYILGVVNATPSAALDAQNYWYIGDTAQAALPGVAGSTPVGGSVSRVADNFLVPADFIPSTGSAAATPNTADVTSYIQNLYTNPGPNGFTPGSSFLVVRLNGDASPPPASGTQRYFLARHTNTNEALRPLVTLETVPEPSSLAIAILGALTFWGYRRCA